MGRQTRRGIPSSAIHEPPCRVRQNRPTAGRPGRIALMIVWVGWVPMLVAKQKRPRPVPFACTAGSPKTLWSTDLGQARPHLTALLMP